MIFFNDKNKYNFQADIVLISTSQPNGLCFIETAELDGETNLKVRQALEETCGLEDHIDQLLTFDGRKFDFENKNNRCFFLYFSGN